MLRRLLLSLAIASAVAACAANTSQQTADVTAAQRLNQAQSMLVVAQAGALSYSTQPWCGDPGSKPPPACASPRAVIEIRRASATAVVAVRTAQSVVADLTSPSANTFNKIEAAIAAVNGFRDLVALYWRE